MRTALIFINICENSFDQSIIYDI